MFDLVCQNLDGVEDGVVGSHSRLGVELMLEDGATFAEVCKGRTGSWVATTASCFGGLVCVFHVFVVVRGRGGRAWDAWVCGNRNIGVGEFNLAVCFDDRVFAGVRGPSSFASRLSDLGCPCKDRWWGEGLVGVGLGDGVFWVSASQGVIAV